MIVDASGQVLGRLASVVAKKLLEGEKITIINAEKAIITGSRSQIVQKYLARRVRGDPKHGPFYPKGAAQIFRRTVRGMLPWKKRKGREAFKRLHVFCGNPSEEKGVKLVERRIRCKYITLEELEEGLK
jgi:large subunit ribosomal protein L13